MGRRRETLKKLFNFLKMLIERASTLKSLIFCEMCQLSKFFSKRKIFKFFFKTYSGKASIIKKFLKFYAIQIEKASTLSFLIFFFIKIFKVLAFSIQILLISGSFNNQLTLRKITLSYDNSSCILALKNSQLQKIIIFSRSSWPFVGIAFCSFGRNFEFMLVE